MAKAKKRYPDHGTLSPEILRGIACGVADVRAGRVSSWESVKKQLNIEDGQRRDEVGKSS